MTAHPAGGPTPLPRSYLYVPGNTPTWFDKALRSGADAVILDLEDAVPPAEKVVARREVAAFVAEQDPAGPVELWVRLNPGPTAVEDLAMACEGAALTGVVLAKATPNDLISLAKALGDRPLLVSPLVETPGAVLQVQELVGAPRVTRVQLGEYDLCAAAGIEPGEDEAEVAWARGMVVHACAASGSTPPVAPVSVNTGDLDALRRSTERLRRQGFFGRACIHPAQLTVVHEVFTPSDRVVDEARRVLQIFDEGLAAGRGAVADDRGRMIDEAVARIARRTLSMVRPAQ